ncbi:DUF29 domain-containing protein [Trichothermofontia sp.]
MHANTRSRSLYEADFYVWTQQQAELLRSGRLAQLDVENLVEEIEALGRQERQGLRNRLGILLGHLLKWHYQPEGRSRSWSGTIREQRQRILEHLEENLSLKPYLPEALAKGYQYGLHLVERETPIDLNALPPSCPFSIAEILEAPIALPDK